MTEWLDWLAENLSNMVNELTDAAEARIQETGRILDTLTTQDFLDTAHQSTADLHTMAEQAHMMDGGCGMHNSMF